MCMALKGLPNTVHVHAEFDVNKQGLKKLVKITNFVCHTGTAGTVTGSIQTWKTKGAFFLPRQTKPLLLQGGGDILSKCAPL